MYFPSTHQRFANWFLNESLEWVTSAVVPPPPGTIQKPADHVRLYHYTRVDENTADNLHKAAEALRSQGIDISKARGRQYGEPNVVWASTQRPGDFKVYAEFTIAMDDPRWVSGKPSNSPEAFEKSGWDAYFNDSIKPNEILAVYEPWHHRYYYMQNNPNLITQAKEGKFDNLLSDSSYGPAVARVKSER